MNKLSNLKFTFGVPQIDYTKINPTDKRGKSKSKYTFTATK
jgi:hypothetical protein